MKKLIALLLSLILVFSLCSVSAFADNESSTESGSDATLSEKAAKLFASTSDEDLLALALASLTELNNRKLITDETYMTAMLIVMGMGSGETATKDLPNEYSFGQGTFVVGLDLKPGTYDITCETSSGSDMDSSMAGLSDFYNSQGMSEYADMFGSLSGMYDSIGGLTVMTYKPNTDYYDQYLTLKVGETARIILEDGGKIVISDGTAKLVWVR